MGIWSRLVGAASSDVPAELVVVVDRESVSMGDDARTHRRELRVPAGSLVSDVVERSSPDVRAQGWSWVAVVDGTVVAVWSVDHGVALLVPDGPLTAPDPSGVVQVRFRYLGQLDPAWLHARLAEGAPLDRDALDAEYAPTARAVLERERREREASTTVRLLGPTSVRALERLGAVIDLHSDELCRFDVGGVAWHVELRDTMTVVFGRGHRSPLASLRPVGLAERWVLAALAVDRRVADGLDPLPDAPVRARAEPVDLMVAGRARAVEGSSGAAVAQLADAGDVGPLDLVLGRDLDEVVALFGLAGPGA
ncbi:hypothetical protein [Frigoribacterium sp. CFBP 13707]|uniref:hypothetical protein n=1 Tax=Frigoribacterium sp. CFBP 13707 TaxID=2775313 RepID=UPI00177B96C1|nr:hypothetical protein [Frigoribacterium sp. CFBP 13707]MBD8729071.1 hypothetical protein [Frigoribacterium sp. CFBP 13707]